MDNVFKTVLEVWHIIAFIAYCKDVAHNTVSFISLFLSYCFFKTVALTWFPLHLEG